MEIRTPKRIADAIATVQLAGFTEILLSDNFVYCFKPDDFKKLIDFINQYDAVISNLHKENYLFPKFFYVAYDKDEEKSTMAIDNEVAFSTFLSAYKCAAYIIPAKDVLDYWKNDWSWPEQCISIDYRDN